MTDTVAAALEIAGKGRPVFPLKPGGKTPLTQHGFKDASTNDRLIRFWWRRHPRANIGMPTGSGLVVIDIDPRSGGEVDPAWPETLTISTASGGWHLYYRSAEPVRCSSGRVAAGIDVRGEGGYVVVPPSRTDDGCWAVAKDLPMAELPDLGLVGQGPRKRAGSVPPGWEPFELLDVVPRGARNDYLARLTGSLLRDGVSPLEAEDLVHAYNESACSPPLDAPEVSRIVANIQRYHA